VKDWFALQSKPRQEIVAEQSLGLRHIETFCPKIKEKKILNGTPRESVGPMFPGYLFARFDLASEYQAARYAHGVKRVVAFGERPAIVPEWIVVSIQERTEGGVLVYEPPVLRSGIPIEIIDGPFQGFRAILERQMKSRDRVVVLLTALQYEARLTLDRLQITLAR
jgi:transcriptional antiterminator RfaH